MWLTEQTCALLGLVNQGDEVIILEPYFDLYKPQTIISGGVPKTVPLIPPA